MIRVLADANIFLEFFINRGGRVEDAEKLLEIAESQQIIKVYITDYCLEKIRFYLGKPDPQYGEEVACWVKETLNDWIIPIENSHIDQVRASSVGDIDSAVELNCAMAMNLDAIVTQNPEKFTGANLAVLSVGKLLERKSLEEILEKGNLPALLVGSLVEIRQLEKNLEKRSKHQVELLYDDDLYSVEVLPNSANQKPIALISVTDDPAIEIGKKEEAGGQNVYVRQVGEALAQLGWQVDMFTRKTSADQTTIVEHSPNCRTIRLTAGPEEFVPRDNTFGYAPEFVQEFLKFQQQSGVQYPVVHTNYWISSWVGMELKKIQGSKQVHTYHSLGAVEYKSVSTIPMIAKTRLAVEKVVLETAERIVATSPQEKAHMRSLVSSKGNIDIIPCGTAIHQFGPIQRQQARAQLGIDSEAKVVLYVGRFDQRKGIETLVRAVGQSQLCGKADLKLIIGGSSRLEQSNCMERDRIESIVDELGMRDFTIFPGRLGGDVLPVYYAAADVCVVPSHYESFGLVAIEAMASGTPVVASDVGGLQFTVIPEETGLLAPPKDEVAFAAAIDRILSDPTYRTKLGQAARKRVETKFRWEGVASQLSELYTELLEQPPGISATQTNAMSA